MKVKVDKFKRRFSDIIPMFGMNVTHRRGFAALIFATALLFLHAVPLWATDHSGHITGDSTWTLAESPHIVICSVTVDAGASLTIEPGVYVQLDAGQDIIIYGTLTAVGMRGNEILFTRSGASSWNGLYFYSSGGGTFDYCTLEYSSNGLYQVSGSTGAISLSNSTLKYNNYGMRAEGGAMGSINNRVVSNTNYGTYLLGTASASFGSSVSQWNDIYGNGQGNDGRDIRNGTSNTQFECVYYASLGNHWMFLSSKPPLRSPSALVSKANVEEYLFPAENLF